MRHTRMIVMFFALVVGIATLVASACVPTTPALRVNLADGASEVPLSTTLEITAANARLEQAVLQRIDEPGPAVDLAKSDSGARLAGALEPDAEYRLMASAEPNQGTPLPWSEPPTKLFVERTFSTVHRPLLMDADAPLVFSRGQPLLLHFSEPLAQARVLADGVKVDARIASDDPRLVRLELDRPRPGEELMLRLRDVMGKNGVPAEEETVVVQIPDAVQIVGVNGSPGPEVAVPPELPVLVELSTKVSALKYRINDKDQSWSGAPTTDVEIPLTLASEDHQTLTIVEANGVEGGWLEGPQVYDLVGAAPLKLAAFWPSDGATEVPPNGDPTFRFSEPIVDRAAAESAISFEPKVPGRFEWLAPNRVHFIPAENFPRESEVQVTVAGGPKGVKGASGVYLQDTVTWKYGTGKEKRIDVSLSRQVLTLYENDEAIWSAPVATGVRGAETPPGTYSVQYKMRQARFRGVNPNGSRYDIPDVNWVLAFYGDYTIHGAYWRSAFGTPGSNGCISLTDANARRVWLWADEGTTVVVRR